MSLLKSGSDCGPISKLSDEALAALIGDTRDEWHVLHVDGTPAGFAEFDRRQPHEVELVQFSLMPEFIGKGLGKIRDKR